MSEAFSSDADREAFERRVAARRAHLGERATRLAEMRGRQDAAGHLFADGQVLRHQEASHRADQVRTAARQAVAYIREKKPGLKPTLAKGTLLNEPGNRRFPTVPETLPKTSIPIPLVGGKRVSPRRVHTPAGKLRQMRPKHEELEVWILENPKVKRMRHQGLAVDAEGEFYTLGTGEKGEMMARRVDPLALAEGPANWQKLYGDNPRPEFTDDTVGAWQTYLDDFVVRQTDPALAEELAKPVTPNAHRDMPNFNIPVPPAPEPAPRPAPRPRS